MNRFFALFLLCVASLSIGVFALSRPPKVAKSDGAATNNAGPAIPEYVIYRQLFHQVVALNEYADQLESQGKAPSSARSVFKRQAELTDEQALILARIATECEREVKQQDLKAKAIIDAYSAQYPDGRVLDGQPPAPPSPELASMQADRNDIILRARDRLRVALGEEEFSRFEAFAKRHIAPNIKPLSAAQLRALPHE
jgi:hypothetical protein